MKVWEAHAGGTRRRQKQDAEKRSKRQRQAPQARYTSKRQKKEAQARDINKRQKQKIQASKRLNEEAPARGRSKRRKQEAHARGRSKTHKEEAQNGPTRFRVTVCLPIDRVHVTVCPPEGARPCNTLSACVRLLACACVCLGFALTQSDGKSIRKYIKNRS